MSAHETPGSSLLLAARRAAGLTQEEVADRAGMSVRAVRLLENGATRAPRRSSVQALADALGLDVDQAAYFTRCWTQMRRTMPLSSVSFSDLDVDTVLALHQAVNADSRDIAVFSRMVVGADHHFDRSELRLVVEAIDDDVRGRTFLWMDAPATDASRLQITVGQGCRVATRTVSAEHNLVAFEVRFPHLLARGETFLMTLTVDFADAVRRTQRPDTYDGCGFRQHVDLCVCEVEFVGDLPRRVVIANRPTDAPHRRHPLAAVAPSCQAVFRHVEPGNYGIEWEW